MGLIDLTGFGTLLSTLGFIYWVVALGALYFALATPKTVLGRTLWGALVLVVFGTLPLMGLRDQAEQKQKTEAMQARRAKAEALFKDHCKKAGIKIHRTVEGVEGVYLMKVRTTFNTEKQYDMDDPYGIDSTGDDYIRSFIGGIDKFNLVNPLTAIRPGYEYVEAIDPEDSQLKHFTGRIEQPWLTDSKQPKDLRRFVMYREPIAQRTARYGVTYDDISTKEDRDYWIAGSSLRVVDLDTNEVIAERIGYMMDPAQGAGVRSGRQAWTYAARNACPAFPLIYRGPDVTSADQTRLFVEKVLKIKEE